MSLYPAEGGEGGSSIHTTALKMSRVITKLRSKTLGSNPSGWMVMRFPRTVMVLRGSPGGVLCSAEEAIKKRGNLYGRREDLRTESRWTHGKALVAGECLGRNRVVLIGRGKEV